MAETTRPPEPQHRPTSLWIDIAILTALTLPFAFYLASTGFPNILNSTSMSDGVWYLNRAQLLGHAYVDKPLTIVYTLLYPLSIRGLLLIVGDLMLAAILVNTLALLLAVLGTYVLGRALYNRRVAWFAALFMLTVPHFSLLTHDYFSPYVLMNAVLVWMLVALHGFITRPTIPVAIFLGVMFGAGVYMRLEFVLYAALLLPAGWIVYQRNGRALALRQMIIAGGIASVPILIYASMMLGNATGDVPANAQPIQLMLETLPTSIPIWDSRFAASFLRGPFLLAPWWIWVGVLAAVLWPLPENRTKNRLFALIIPFNLLYVFGFAAWPQPTYLSQSLPAAGLLCGVMLTHLLTRHRYGRLAYALAIALLVVPVLVNAGQIAQSGATVLGYRSSPAMAVGPQLDQWLADHNYPANTEIYTFCGEPILAGQANYHYLYRLQSSSDPHFDSNQWWNSPEQLLPHMAATGKLFLRCNETVTHFRDWRDYFEQKQTYSHQLVEVGRIEPYIFYEAAAIDD
jgi:4-amino-4-deoxy-L-arabinose transferase-like glycosyltransferase